MKKEAANKQIMQTIANIYRNAKPRKLFSYALSSDKAIKYTECVCSNSPTKETRKRRPIWSKQIFDITGLLQISFSLSSLLCSIPKMELIQKITRSLVTDPCPGLSAFLKFKFLFFFCCFFLHWKSAYWVHLKKARFRFVISWVSFFLSENIIISCPLERH